MASSSSASYTHNFKIDLDKSLIPLLIGRGGKNLFIKVIKASIDEFKELDDGNKDIKEIIASVKEGKIEIKQNIKIKYNDAIGTYGSWNDVESLGNANITFHEIVKHKLVEAAKSVNDYNSTKKEKSSVKKYRQNFNFRMHLENCSIGQFIGNGGEIINDFKKKISEELDVEKVFIKIDKYDSKNDFQYRVIGSQITAEDIVFGVTFFGGDRSDIHKVEKMLINFVNENYEELEYESDNEKEEDEDEDGDGDEEEDLSIDSVDKDDSETDFTPEELETIKRVKRHQPWTK